MTKVVEEVVCSRNMLKVKELNCIEQEGDLLLWIDLLEHLKINLSKELRQVIYEIVLTYNNKGVHSATGLTPNQARKKEKTIQIKTECVNKSEEKKYTLNWKLE